MRWESSLDYSSILCKKIPSEFVLPSHMEITYLLDYNLVTKLISILFNSNLVIEQYLVMPSPSLRKGETVNCLHKAEIIS